MSCITSVDGIVLWLLIDDYRTAQVVETSVTVNNNSPIQDYALPEIRDKMAVARAH